MSQPAFLNSAQFDFEHFELNDMIRTIVDMSPNHAKLLFGGSLLAAGNRNERAAMA